MKSNAKEYNDYIIIKRYIESCTNMPQVKLMESLLNRFSKKYYRFDYDIVLWAYMNRPKYLRGRCPDTVHILINTLNTKKKSFEKHPQDE